MRNELTGLKKLNTVQVYEYSTSFTLYLNKGNNFIAYWSGPHNNPTAAKGIGTGKSAEECEREARKYLHSIHGITWLPAIRIGFPFPTEWQYGGPVWLAYAPRRCYVGQNPINKEWKEEQWSCPEDGRIGNAILFAAREPIYPSSSMFKPMPPMPEGLPFRCTTYGEKLSAVYMAYTPELWETIEELNRRVNELKTRLMDLVAEPGLMALTALLSPTPAALPAAPLLLLPPPPVEVLEAETPTPAELAAMTPKERDAARVFCPGFLSPTSDPESEDYKRYAAAPPCCDRAGEYNGFGEGPLTFTCPKGCPCHD